MNRKDQKPHVCRWQLGQNFGDRVCETRDAAVEFSRKIIKDGGQASVFPVGGRPFNPLLDAGEEEDA